MIFLYGIFFCSLITLQAQDLENPVLYRLPIITLKALALYKQSPDRVCYNCKNDDYLKCLQSFASDVRSNGFQKIVSFDDLRQSLKSNEALLQELKKEGEDYYFWPSEEQKIKQNLADQALYNLKIAEDKITLNADNLYLFIIKNFYKNRPVKNYKNDDIYIKDIIEWVEQQVCSKETYQFIAYHEIIKKHLEFIQKNLDENNIQTMHEILEIRNYLYQSKSLTKKKFQEENAYKNNLELSKLKQKETQENIENARKLVESKLETDRICQQQAYKQTELQRALVQEQEKLVQAKKLEAEKLAYLVFAIESSSLKNIDDRYTSLHIKMEKEKIEKAIASLNKDTLPFAISYDLFIIMSNVNKIENNKELLESLREISKKIDNLAKVTNQSSIKKNEDHLLDREFKEPSAPPLLSQDYSFSLSKSAIKK